MKTLIDQLQTMATYNQWVNEKIYDLCGKLSDVDRKADRKAFFKSIHGTLNHLLLVDRLWLGRLQGRPRDPQLQKLDTELYADFDTLRKERKKTDADIIAWAATVTDKRLEETLSFFSMTMDRNIAFPCWHCAIHFFNHQTHHRGQITALLNQLGLDYGATDLLWLPGREQKSP